MKLRSGLSVGMNPDTKAVKGFVDSLGDLFKQGEILMASDNCNNCDKVTEIISNVNSTYDKLIFLCSTTSESDVLPGTSLTRLDVDERYWNFKLKAKQWFESFSDSAIGEQAQIVSESKVSSQAEASRIYTVSEPKLAKLLPSKESGISELSKMPLCASEPRSQDQRQSSSFVFGLNELNEPIPGTVTKPASKNSRISGSKSGRTSVSSSKKQEALIKLKLARQQKTHNEERIREEQEIERLRHLKLIADDQRRVEAAELEAALYHSDATEDKLSCSSNDNLSNAPKYKDNLFKNVPATTFQSKFSHLSTTKTTSFFRALPTLDSTRNMASVDFLQPKAQTSVRFATQPFQASWQEGVARHSSHHNPVVAAAIDAAPQTQFSRENQADFTLRKLT